MNNRNLPIGLLGGSFNPAHEGHIHISMEALKRLGLREVWWLVSPHNPLKNKKDLMDYDDRLATARQMALPYFPRIRVLDIERRLGTRYTADTLEQMRRLFPRARFVWLMGADNLAGFHRWQEWDNILKNIPIAVFDRAPHSHRALRSRAALAFSRFRLPEYALMHVAETAPPAWAYLHLRRDPHSATQIRKTLGKFMNLGHN